MYKLSIIVPVYNTKKQLGKCLDSLLCQVREGIELIVINDGSTDASEEVIKEYDRKYPNKITYYSKPNSGVADTRNLGIQKAQGKYIYFVDSDDYIEFDLVQTLERYMDTDIDIIKFKLQRVDEQGKTIKKVEGPIFSKVQGEQAFNMLAFEDVLLDSPCVYFIKKELFVNNHLAFKVGTEHEDFGLIPLILLKANTVISVPNYGYYYVQSEDSITRNEEYPKTIKKFQDVLSHYDNMLSFIEQETFQEVTKQNIKTYYTNAILLKLKELKRGDQDTYLKEIKKRKMIDNIQVYNIKQLLKKMILKCNVRWYLKLR